MPTLVPAPEPSTPPVESVQLTPEEQAIAERVVSLRTEARRLMAFADLTEENLSLRIQLRRAEVASNG